MLSIFLFKYATQFFDFLSGLLPESFRTLPAWVITGWNYVTYAVGKGVHLLSWLFPSQAVYTAFCMLALDVGTLCIGIKFFRTISKLVHRVKAT